MPFRVLSRQTTIIDIFTAHSHLKFSPSNGFQCVLPIHSTHLPTKRQYFRKFRKNLRKIQAFRDLSNKSNF